MKATDLTGKIFDRWVVLSRAENNARGETYWLCSCACGVQAAVLAGSLRRGKSTSCGCRKLELLSTNNGATKIDGYGSWAALISRCTNVKDKAYPRYGGAGIGVYAAWLTDFQAFISYMGPRPTPDHSIDRIDGSKGYEPGNVKWSTRIEQNANRKNTAMVEYQGVVQPLSLLARARGLAPKIVYNRVFHYGWSIERALSTP